MKDPRASPSTRRAAAPAVSHPRARLLAAGLVLFVGIVSSCSTTATPLHDHVAIPGGAVDCGVDSQVGDSDSWTYKASTCVRDKVESGADAWMVTDFTDPDGEVGVAILVATSSGSLRRYAEGADGRVLQNDLCASIEWADVEDGTFAIRGVECQPVE